MSNSNSSNGSDAAREFSFPHIGTVAVRAGFEPEKYQGWPVVLPISLATTFKQAAPAEHQGFDYSRAGNPTRNDVEKNIAALENAKFCSLFSSGLASLNALIFALLHAGDHIVCNSDVYGGTNRYLRTVISNFGVEHTFVDLRDAAALGAAVKPNTKLLVIETPTNPMMRIIDIAETSKLFHALCPAAIVVVDNTFASPCAQRPLELGADVVWHSCTKYLNGHSDVVIGALCTNDAQFDEKFKYQLKAVGAVPSPFDCFLLWRGVKTLHLRMRQHEANAMELALCLKKHPLVRAVYYPGLATHPEHALACKQMHCFSGMLSFVLLDSVNTELVKLLLKQLKYFTVAESLGTVGSLIEVPSLMTHTSVLPEQRAALGISDQLIRISVGLEDAADLCADITAALDTVAALLKKL